MKKDKYKKRYVSRFTIIVFLGSFLGLGIFAALPALFYGGMHNIWEQRQYILWYFLYWAIITAGFTVFTEYQKYRSYDKPMRALGAAAEKVAAGDFSVYVSPVGFKKRHNYINNMIEDFNVMVRELGSLETLKTDFISNVSHELKTPLAVIQNYSMALKDPTLDPKVACEYIEIINVTSKKLAKVISNILILNKLDNQSILPPTQPYNIVRQLADNLLEFDQMLTEKVLTVEFESEDRALVNADEAMVQIIWQNLFSNAIKFTEANGTIFIRQTSTEEFIEIEVEDTGIGMGLATQRRVFEKFYQGDTSHSKEGNGLGMSLVWRVVELLEGTITVKSEINSGTTFTVRLPAYFDLL